jgi:hypothetical protein
LVPKKVNQRKRPSTESVYHDKEGSGGKWVQHTLHDCKIRQELEAKKKAGGGGKPAAQMKVTGMVAVLPEDNDS